MRLSCLIVLGCVLLALDAFLQGLNPRFLAPNQHQKLLQTNSAPQFQKPRTLQKGKFWTRAFCSVAGEDSLESGTPMSEENLENSALHTSTEDFKRMRYKLLLYDHGKFDGIVTKHRLGSIVQLTMDVVEDLVAELCEELNAMGESTALFGKRHNNAIEGMVGAISQTFDGQLLYPTVEAQAAQLLYSVIKGHPYLDGNKRIAVSLFVKFLELNKYLINEHGHSVLNGGHLLTLVITIAESKPEDQDRMVKSIVDMLVREATFCGI